MFDKQEFDLEMEKVREEQIEDLADRLADYITINSHIRDMKISDTPDEETLKRIAEMPIPQNGRNVREVTDEMVRDIYQHSVLRQHPRFFSFVPSAVSPYSVAASILSDIYNPHGGGWKFSPAACLIEQKIIKWMGAFASYPEETCGGLFVSGGSMANMTSLIAARNAILKDTEYSIGVAYISDQGHSSLAKGLRMIGFRNDQIIKIETDDEFRMRVDLLEKAVQKDIADGKKPFVVVGTLGTTNTGSIDPLSEIGDICKKYGMWFHVDAAYGGSSLISDIYRNLSVGIEKSDSFSWDTHKWALQTYGCSSVIAKDKNNLINAFSEHPEYLEDIRNKENFDPWDLGPEMTRPHRSLKFWATLQCLGTDRLADIVDYAFYNAKTAEKVLLQKEGWEITSKPMCGTVTFRFAPAGYPAEEIDALNGTICEKVNASGYAYVVTSVLKGKRVIRLCLINGNTTTEDVLSTIELLDHTAHELIR